MPEVDSHSSAFAAFFILSPYYCIFHRDLTHGRQCEHAQLDDDKHTETPEG